VHKSFAKHPSSGIDRPHASLRGRSKVPLIASVRGTLPSNQLYRTQYSDKDRRGIWYCDLYHLVSVVVTCMCLYWDLSWGLEARNSYAYSLEVLYQCEL
jgi:hypothetical protein